MRQIFGRGNGEDGSTAASNRGEEPARTRSELASSDPTPVVGRRRFVGALGAAAAAGLAGCSSGGASGPPIAQPESHAQDMTMTIGEAGATRLQQRVSLQRDDPDFLLEFSTSAAGGTGVPVFNGRFVRTDGTVYVQFLGVCREASRGAGDVQAMAATSQRFGSKGALERTGTTTLDGVEVEVWEADVSDLPLDQLGFQPETSGGFGGQLPSGGQSGGSSSSQQPAFFDPDDVLSGHLTLWIGTENDYLRKAEQTATFTADDTEFEFDMTAENYDFGADFDIQAPSNCGEGSFGGGGGDDGGFGGGGFGG